MSIPADQLRRMLEQTLVPPTQVIELDPDTIGATTARLARFVAIWPKGTS